MTRRTGLGRGLDALIPGGDRPVEGGVMLVSTSRISPNPRQPRGKLDPERLEELAASIREHGVIQPLIVTHSTNAGDYILVAGERRLIAAQQAGLDLVPVLVREATDQQRLELALIENVQRADLNPMETAEAYRQLAEDFQLTHEQIAERVGKSRVAVTNTLRLLKLPPSLKLALVEERISEGHARALLSLPTPQSQAALLEIILKKSLNVRQTEELVARLMGQRAVEAVKPAPSPEISHLEKRLETSLGTRVRLSRGQKGGTLTIHFYSDEELNALVDRLLGG